MFEVHCPACRASYQVDERRVPPTGLKMRCPKCGESFQVSVPGAAPPVASVPAPSAKPVLGAALGLGSAKPTVSGGMAAPPRPAGPPPRPGKTTVLGVAPAAVPEPSRLELDSLDDIEPEAPSELEMELPSAPTHDEPDEDASFDLPVPRPNLDGLALPEVSPPAPRSREIELPSIDSEVPLEADDDGEFDLPLPQNDFGGLPDLPTVGGPPAKSPTASVSRAHAFDDLPDLTPDLPIVGGAGLPEIGADLPLIGAGLPESSPKSINLPSVSSQLPTLTGSLPEAQMAPSKRSNDPASFGEVDFGGGGEEDPFGTHAGRPEEIAPGERAGAGFGQVGFGAGDEDEGEFDAFPTETKGGDKSTERASGGGTGYGDVALDGGSGDLALGADVEREPAPAGPPAAATAQVVVPAAPTTSTGPKIAVPRLGASTRTKVAASVGFAVALGGGLLALAPDVGPYGAYFVIDSLKAESNGSDLDRDIATLGKRLALDTPKEVDAAYREFTRGQGDAPRFRPRQAYRAYLGLYRHFRFGPDSAAVSEAKVLLNQLRADERTTEHFFEAAEIAELLASGKFDEVMKRGRASAKSKPEIARLVAEAALRLHDADAAEAAFRVASKGPSAYLHFGLARVLASRGKYEEARAALAETRKLSPNHILSEVLSIQLSLSDVQKDDAFASRLTALSTMAGASAFEKARTFTVLGRLHLGRSRLKQAEVAFADALKIVPGDPDAQIGLAESLYQAGRFAEALARYEAALNADPRSLDAELGVVQAKLRLEALEDASRILQKLLAAHPKSTRVQFYLGRVKEAVGDRATAQQGYEAAIDAKEDCPELVQAYIALTRLHGQMGNLAAAELVIHQAEQRFPSNPDVYRALAELASSRGQFDEAIKQLDRALALDEKNIGFRFLRGIALRQARKYEDAMVEFDEVEKVERDYPGLSLERGNLYEAAGHADEALRSYEAALATAPNDPDLKLRVGCAKANVGQTEAARQLLEKVLEERPHSGEVNYCLGIALLREGKDLPQAKRFFERALGLDMTRANYHLYLGWVLIELRDYSGAQRALEKSIELDQSLADAYWQRGVLRVRQGAVKDAELDLRRALELAPSRYEAHAALADAYTQAGREPDALVEWQAAMAGGTIEPFWHYSYARLLLENRQLPEAKAQLEQALAKLEKGGQKPPWIWDAHRLFAMSLGRSKEALPHWQAFAENQPNSPYVREAVREMKTILAMP